VPLLSDFWFLENDDPYIYLFIPSSLNYSR
jgi:hypothetical protein